MYLTKAKDVRLYPHRVDHILKNGQYDSITQEEAAMKRDTISSHISRQWRSVFTGCMDQPEHAESLQNAIQAGSLDDWTSTISALIIETCYKMKWYASGKGHRTRMLPIYRSTYLDVDVMAFAERAKKWQFPIAVFELEEQPQPDRIAYNLWKLFCIQARFRALFCYQPSPKDAPQLMHYLTKELVHALPAAEKVSMEEDTLVIIGTEGPEDTFPMGYFSWWQLDRECQRFRMV